jgi:hypothetical protein
MDGTKGMSGTHSICLLEADVHTKDRMLWPKAAGREMSYVQSANTYTYDLIDSLCWRSGENANSTTCEDIIFGLGLMQYTTFEAINASVHTLCHQDIRTIGIVSKSVGILKSILSI